MIIIAQAFKQNERRDPKLKHKMGAECLKLELPKKPHKKNHNTTKQNKTKTVDIGTLCAVQVGIRRER